MRLDCEKGLQLLVAALWHTYPQILPEFKILKSRLLKNMDEGRLYGQNDPANPADWAPIIDELNQKTLEWPSQPFNDFCASQPMPLPLDEQRSIKGPPKRLPANIAETAGYRGIKNRWAVLAGVQDYHDKAFSPLPVCLHDVTDISRQLVKGGFDPNRVKTLVDGAPAGSLPTRDNILAALTSAAHLAQEDDLLLFYYTGHGDREEGESYLITQSGRDRSLKHTALSIAQVKEIFQSTRARSKIIILDACHVGASIGKGPVAMTQEFIQRVFEQAEGIVILSSCLEHEQSYAWQEQKRSVFTYYLLEALEGKADRDGKGSVTVTDINSYVYYYVTNWAFQHNCIQTPKISSDMQGEITVGYYIKEDVSASPAASISPLSQSQTAVQPRISVRQEAIFWAELETVTVCGTEFMLYKDTIRERWTRDKSAYWQKTKAQQLETHHLVWLQQAYVVCATRQSDALRNMLTKEYQLLKTFEEDGCRDFPRPFLKEANEYTTIIAHTALTGQSLQQVFSHPGKPLDPHLIFSLLQKIQHICDALKILHRKHYSHRAITPEEILLPDGGRAMLQTVGLAAWPSKEGEGPLSYQAPEQLHNTKDLSIPGPCTDIYQLGASLYFLLTGQLLSCEERKPSKFNSVVSPDLDTLVLSATKTRPSERWPNIHDFSSALKQAMK